MLFILLHVPRDPVCAYSYAIPMAMHLALTMSLPVYLPVTPTLWP